MARCKAKAKSGKQCRANATANGFCSIHEYPGRAAELSRKAVEARHRTAAEAQAKAEILPPKTPDELLVSAPAGFVSIVPSALPQEIRCGGS